MKPKKRPRISKKELEKADPNLLPPTQDVVTNLARGDDDLVPDPDNIPGGFNSNLTHRLNMNEADYIAGLESSEKPKATRKSPKNR